MSPQSMSGRPGGIQRSGYAGSHSCTSGVGTTSSEVFGVCRVVVVVASVVVVDSPDGSSWPPASDGTATTNATAITTAAAMVLGLTVAPQSGARAVRPPGPLQTVNVRASGIVTLRPAFLPRGSPSKMAADTARRRS